MYYLNVVYYIFIIFSLRKHTQECYIQTKNNTNQVHNRICPCLFLEHLYMYSGESEHF